MSNETRLDDHKQPHETDDILLIDSNGEPIRVSSIPATIGRGDENEVIIDNDSLDEKHARIVFDERVQEICVEDLDSPDGIFVNQKPTTKNILYPGSELRLGSVILTYQGRNKELHHSDETK